MSFMSLPLIVWPMVLFIAAALIVPHLRRWVNREGFSLLVLLAHVIAFLSLLVVVQQSTDHSFDVLFSDWRGLAGAGGGIRFQVDTLAVSFLLLTGLVGMGALVGSLDEQDEVTSEDYQAGLLAFFGGLVALGMAGNLLTLLLSSLLIDGALLYGIGFTGRPRWLLAAFLHALVAQGLTIGATLLLWEQSGGTALDGAGNQVLLLLVGAAVFRMAPLPFSLYPVAFEALPQRVMALMPLATLGVGSLLLGRVAQVIPPGGGPDLDGLASVAALGVALAGWVAWRREGQNGKLMMLAAVHAAWSIWAFAWGMPVAAVAVGWGAVPALAALAIHGGYLDFRHGAQLPGLIAALMVVGFPGSVLWNAATLLGGEAWARGDQWSLALGIVGTMGMTVTLIRWLLPLETEPYRRSRWTGVIMLAVLSVPFAALFWGIRVPDLAEAAPAAGPLAAQVAMLVIGWAGGLLLWRDRHRLQSIRPLLDAAAGFFSFVWFWRLAGRAGWLLLSGFRGILLLLEGENYGWLLLFLFITLVFLLPQ